MKKVAIFTTFLGYLESYSLCSVARTQLKMLKQNGYDPMFIYRGGGGWEDVVSDIKETPDFICDNDGSSKGMEQRAKTSYDSLVEEMLSSLRSHLKDVDVVITHDLFFQHSNRIQDDACAKYAAENDKILWLHWIHSATSSRDIAKQAKRRYPHSFICYPNAFDTPRIATNFGYEEPDIKCVPHPLDYVDFFDMHPITEKLINEKGIMGVDVLGVYPLRLDRGKQPEKVIRIFNQIKHYCERTIRLIIMDFQSTGGDKVKYRNQMKDEALNMGWSSDELIFMSEFDKSCNMETPKKVVRDLFMLSNIYIHPSKSETYSLTTQEARACKNMLVLNYHFPAMRTIYGDGPIYKNFGANFNIADNVDGETTPGYNPSEEMYMRDEACAVNYHLENQAVLAMSTETRKNKNMQAVFKRHIEPLFFAE